MLADVYRDHADFVWRVARRLGAPEDALEDVVHDVFLVVHRRLSEYDGRAAMTTWLFHITRGVVSNTRRGRARAEQRLQLVEPPRPTLTPEERSDRAGAARFVRAFLDTLPADRRELFTLVDVEGLSVRAAAEHLGVNVNTAHARLRAARSAFREAVRERDRSAPARSARS
ncbi:MAG: sigma-70 family RNA polymerase sigma factor [Myxococcales bacterium]|nr:sigma-70 family RNA polymerase sigma factor [Myxococcales bacterium]